MVYCQMLEHLESLATSGRRGGSGHDRAVVLHRDARDDWKDPFIGIHGRRFDATESLQLVATRVQEGVSKHSDGVSSALIMGGGGRVPYRSVAPTGAEREATAKYVLDRLRPYLG